MWQKCPQCDGKGLNDFVNSCSAPPLCPICLGKKIVSSLSGLPPYHDVETTTDVVKTVVLDDSQSDFIDNINKEVSNDLKNRSVLGFSKYNTTMDRTDLSETEWLQHLYEELLDAAVYTKKLIKLKSKKD